MEQKTFKTVCIVGAGFMGTNIGLHCAVHGYAVWLIDLSKEVLEQSKQKISYELGKKLKKQQITSDEKKAILDRLHFTINMQEGASNAGLVIEAVPERLEIKRKVFAQLDKICPSYTILATNSSSIPISAIEDATHRPDKLLNMHFYIPLCPVVELMGGTATSDETIESTRQFACTIQLTALMVRKESMGFIYNRVWRVIKKECLHLVDDGVASPEDVDRTWMLFWRAPIGPFGMMDLVGLDVVRDIEMVYYHESGDESDAPPKLLLDKIAKGELGIKTGKGFYTYPNPAFQNPSWLKAGTTDCISGFTKSKVE
jgi:3-hydroxybutyryl-CoA dehydrogenase